jgi:hypothetical protein
MKPFSEMFQKEKLFTVNNFIFIFFSEEEDGEGEEEEEDDA